MQKIGKENIVGMKFEWIIQIKFLNTMPVMA
jgi:hypothetical protein